LTSGHSDTNEVARPENDVAEADAINESEAMAAEPACSTVVTNSNYKFLLIKVILNRISTILFKYLSENRLAEFLTQYHIKFRMTDHHSSGRRPAITLVS